MPLQRLIENIFDIVGRIFLLVAPSQKCSADLQAYRGSLPGILCSVFDDGLRIEIVHVGPSILILRPESQVTDAVYAPSDVSIALRLGVLVGLLIHQQGDERSLS